VHSGVQWGKAKIIIKKLGLAEKLGWVLAVIFLVLLLYCLAGFSFGVRAPQNITNCLTNPLGYAIASAIVL